VPIYPAAARQKNIEGSVRLWLEPDGHLVPISGPAALLESTLEIARPWKLTKGDDGAEIHFKYTLIDGDCLGGGPIVKFTGLFDIEVTAKRIAPCGS
jgi:hypothetical protein